MFAKHAKTGLRGAPLKWIQKKMKILLLNVHVVVKTTDVVISRWCLAENGTELFISACMSLVKFNQHLCQILNLNRRRCSCKCQSRSPSWEFGQTPVGSDEFCTPIHLLNHVVFWLIHATKNRQWIPSCLLSRLPVWLQIFASAFPTKFAFPLLKE